MKNLLLGLLVIAGLLSCKEHTDPTRIPLLKASQETIEFSSSGGNATLVITMNGNSWVASLNQSWCSISDKASSKERTNLTIVAAPNTSNEARATTLSFTMDSKETIYVNLKQEGKTAVVPSVYPSYSNWQQPDDTGMSSDAFALAAKMEVGWNLGNSLEVPGRETDWGNPKTSQAFIDAVKASGINAIRIPCSWNSYVENTSTWKLKSSWLARVKEVVDYCYQNDMYVIINAHWDGGWLENNPTFAKQDEVNAKQKAIWEQIGDYFRDYDEHLLFAGTNEVHSDGNPTAENFEVQMSFNQTFVDAIRSTGGKNSFRNIIIQSYNTNIDYAVNSLVVSTDTTDNRLMVEVHYYDPWDFCGLEADASWATMKYLWGADFAQYGPISTWGQEDHVLVQFKKMKTAFVDKGYPVILGEFGAIRRSTLTGNALKHHLASRAYYLRYIAEQAKNYGLVPFFWDNGSGLFNRSDGSVSDEPALDAFLAGAAAGVYPF